MIDEELTKARSAHDPSRVEAYEAAAAILRRLLEAKELADFLTIPAYEKLLEEGL
jgi:malate synthase